MATKQPATERSFPSRSSCSSDEGFCHWIAETGGAFVLSTYQANKAGTVGWNEKHVSLLMREFDKPMGLAFDGWRLAVACRDEVIVTSNDPLLAREFDSSQPGRYDGLFTLHSPRRQKNGQPLFQNSSPGELCKRIPGVEHVVTAVSHQQAHAARQKSEIGVPARVGHLQLMDLLTVVMHELGHLDGLEDLYDAEVEVDLMYAWLELEPAVRRGLLEASLADAVFAEPRVNRCDAGPLLSSFQPPVPALSI